MQFPSFFQHSIFIHHRVRFMSGVAQGGWHQCKVGISHLGSVSSQQFWPNILCHGVFEVASMRLDLLPKSRVVSFLSKFLELTPNGSYQKPGSSVSVVAGASFHSRASITRWQRQNIDLAAAANSSHEATSRYKAGLEIQHIMAQ
jgi:hypothetical protein